MDTPSNSHQSGVNLPTSAPSPVENGLPPVAADLSNQPPIAQIPPVFNGAKSVASTPPAPIVNDTNPSGAAIAIPVTAEDSDLIEQEWVTKAKHIVDSTRLDPHAQNKQISKMKADYIKKRYNKEIKFNEG